MLGVWGPFYKNIWKLVLDYLPQTSRHVMLVNRAFRDLVYKLDRGSDIEATDQELIESDRIRTFMCRGYFNDYTVYLLAKRNYKKILLGVKGHRDSIYWGSCRGGHLGLFKLRKKNIGIAYSIACKGGHEHIVKKFKGMQKITYTTIRSACYGGNKNIINKLIRNYNCNPDEGLIGACEGGHLDIVETMIQMGAMDLDGGLLGACKKGHLDIVKFLLKIGATDYMHILWAFRGGYMDIITLLIDRVNLDWDVCLIYACMHRGNIDIVRMCVDRGAKNFNKALIFASKRANVDIIKYLILLGANCWDDCLSEACSSGRTYIIQLMIDKGATDWNRGLSAACGIYPHVVNWMIIMGATTCDICDRIGVDHIEKETKYEPQN